MIIVIAGISALVIFGLFYFCWAQRRGPAGQLSQGKPEDDLPGQIAKISRLLQKTTGGLTEDIQLQLRALGSSQVPLLLPDWPAVNPLLQKELKDFWHKEKYTEHYIAALGAKKEADRLTAAKVLMTIKDQRTIPPLLAALDQPALYLPARVGEVLLSFGEAATEPLLGMLNQLSAAARCLGIDLLAELGDQRAVLPLTGQLADPLPEVRQKAAAALGEIGGIQGVPGLIAAMTDDDWGVRSRAAKALGQIGDASAVPALQRALEDQTWWVKTNAQEALVMILGEKETADV